jgi:hypothetical protein
MACLLPRSCTLSVPSAVEARDPTKSAKSGSVAPLKPLLTARFFASSAMQLRNTTCDPIVHQRQNNGRVAKMNNNREAQRAAME